MGGSRLGPILSAAQEPLGRVGYRIYLQRRAFNIFGFAISPGMGLFVSRILNEAQNHSPERPKCGRANGGSPPTVAPVWMYVLIVPLSVLRGEPWRCARFSLGAIFSLSVFLWGVGPGVSKASA